MDLILEKYGVKPQKEKKKSKKKSIKKYTGSGLKIVDSGDEMTVSYGSRPALKSQNNEELDDMEEDELPQIANVVDERPIEVQLQEQFKKTDKWKSIAVESSARQSLLKAGDGDLKLMKPRDNTKYDSDTSPPRLKKRNKSPKLDLSPPRRRNVEANASKKRHYRGRSDSDTSPPRKSKRERSDSDRRGKTGNRGDSDVSPPRKNHRDRRDSPARKERLGTSPRRREEGQRSNKSRRDRSASDESRVRKSRQNQSDPSPPRRHRRDDTSPPQRRRDGRQSNRPGRDRSDSDVSPPRRSRKDEADGPSRRRHQKGSDSDASPPRRRKQDSNVSPPKRQQKEDSDASPPRRSRQDNSDSDASPPRRKERSSKSPEPSEKMTKTLDGKRAGLQVAKSLRSELDSIRQQEQEKFSQMDDELTGRYAKTRYRDRETGKLRDFEAEREKKNEEEKKAAARKAQYDRWGKGLKQIEQQEERVQAAVHEMSKPLARYEDDKDLDAHLKSIDREGDPMLKFLAKKRSKASSSGPAKPIYQGPPPPPNRFGILPGYRWDGVDRSNGYEKKFFERINAKKALQEESYKWSVEDL